MTAVIAAELSRFPINLILSARSVDPSYQIKSLITRIDSLHKQTTTTNDPNAIHTLIDYNIISPSNPLMKQFMSEYRLKSNTNTLLLLSFTQEILSTNTEFITSLKNEPFDLISCILNTHTYPYLKDISNNDHENRNLNLNLNIIAKYGLINVSKLKNNSLLLN